MRKIFLTFWGAVLIALFITGCTVVVPDRAFEGGTIVISNHTGRNYSGKVWTDSMELYRGNVRAGKSRKINVSESCTVYIDFESSDGAKTTSSGYVSRGKSVVFDL